MPSYLPIPSDRQVPMQISMIILTRVVSQTSQVPKVWNNELGSSVRYGTTPPVMDHLVYLLPKRLELWDKPFVRRHPRNTSLGTNKI